MSNHQTRLDSRIDMTANFRDSSLRSDRDIRGLDGVSEGNATSTTARV
jgi:hypothetical protein